jgi:hypothetical protein
MDALPAFLLPQTSPVEPLTPAQRTELAQLRQSNELATFEACFNRTLETVASGQSLKAALEDYPLAVDYHRFLRWIHKDETRKAQYFEAQAVCGEAIFNEMIDIADADDSIEDVQRSTLRINTRKWWLSVINRKRFGETRQIEQNITVDLGEAMAAAQRRVSERQDVIDVKSRTISDI